MSDADRTAAQRSGSRAKRVLLWGALAGVAAAPVGWFGTDALERDDDFCNACHLPDGSGTPLHIDVRRDFDAPQAASLAGAHGLARLGHEADERDFRCIDCHGGVGLLGRARVKVLAAKDALVYLTGDFEEPDGMHWPLRDADCAQCHARFDTSPYEEWESPRFHQLPVHNADLGVDCVECHEAHETGGIPTYQFLRADRVRAQCARCHAEYEQVARR
ncbi:MAG: cytochrome c3 family protein [Myxococcota bacterium]